MYTISFAWNSLPFSCLALSSPSLDTPRAVILTPPHSLTSRSSLSGCRFSFIPLLKLRHQRASQPPHPPRRLLCVFMHSDLSWGYLNTVSPKVLLPLPLDKSLPTLVTSLELLLRLPLCHRPSKIYLSNKWHPYTTASGFGHVHVPAHCWIFTQTLTAQAVRHRKEVDFNIRVVG